ncbi:50S ribosomal protein L29 [Phaeovibrio sulfidiphilus]|uniref:Large ribosomal subunit protein uL29 n=1 Tax=Phaeovibrio sulfidiphilus TaxID=1220600 RepID=A0A8J7CBL1_9PROT|nr:50S ribosomal protein L29 [Phaeovibrio sulfidiphilus]MBE1236288.1 50S ribosomal protein L29 [Phaeovibrio sulfidiphilus]
MTDIGDVRSKTDAELKALVLDLKKEQLNLRFEKANGQLENTARFRAIRREIARIRTVQTERNAASSVQGA